MSKKEELLKLMLEYNVNTLYYKTGMDLNAEHPDGALIFEGTENNCFLNKVNSLYVTDDSFDEGQDLIIGMLSQGAALERFKSQFKEVLHANN